MPRRRKDFSKRKGAAREEYIAFDSHKHYTWVKQGPVGSGKVRQYRVQHAPGAIRQALSGCAPGTAVALAK
jgi:hypothetical protein